MKRIVVFGCVMIPFLFASGVCSAAQQEKNIPNGVAFQSLQTEIQANAEVINDINGQINNIESDISAMELDVQDNAAAINNLNDKIAHIQVDLSMTRADLDAVTLDLQALKALHQADISALQAQINSLQAQINGTCGVIDVSGFVVQSGINGTYTYSEEEQIWETSTHTIEYGVIWNGHWEVLKKPGAPGAGRPAICFDETQEDGPLDCQDWREWRGSSFGFVSVNASFDCDL